MTTNQENYKSFSKIAQLYNCCESKYPIEQLVEKVLQKEGNINFQIRANSCLGQQNSSLANGTALHIAAVKKVIDLFDTLLFNDADITIQNQQGGTPLHCIFEHDNDDDEKKELLNIAFATHLSLGDSSNPCDVNGISHFHIACMYDKVDVVEFFLNKDIPIDLAVDLKSKKYAGYSPLHFASEGRALAVIKLLLKNRASMNAKDARGLTPFHVLLDQKIKIMSNSSTQPSDIAALDDVLNSLLDSDDDDVVGLTPFQVACAMQDSSVAEYFLEQDVDMDEQVKMNSPFRPGYTALHFAAHCNQNIAKKLIEKRANFEVRDANGVTPVDIIWRENKSAFAQNWKYVMFSDNKTLLTDFVNVDETLLDNFLINLNDRLITVKGSPVCWTNRSLLHFAAFMCESVAGLKTCLKYGLHVYVNAPDFRGSTPIHLAFRANKLDFVGILMEQKLGYKNLVDEDGLSYLHIACALEKAAHVEQFCFDTENLGTIFRGNYTHGLVKPGSTALHVAMSTGNCEIIDTLLRRGFNLEVEDAMGVTPLREFLKLKDHTERVGHTLLTMNALTDKMLEDMGVTRLFMAVYCKLLDILPYIRSDTINATVNCNDSSSFLYRYNGCTPLHLAMIKRSNDNIVNLLLEKGADLLAINNRGECPLYAALTGSSDWNAMKLIVKKLKSDAVLRNRMKEISGITMLHLTCHLVDEDAVGWLLAANVDADVRVKSNCAIWAGCSPLHVLMKAVKFYGVSDDFYKILLGLLKSKVDVTAVNKDGETPILLALQNFSVKRVYDVLDLLIDKINVFNINPSGANGMSHFHAACLINNVAIVKLFLDNGVNVNQPIDFFTTDYAGETPLHLAVEHKIAAFSNFQSKLEIVDLLLQSGADVNAEDNFGRTALHKAVKLFGSTDIMQKLVQYGADIDSRNIFEQTPLELTLQSENISAAKIEYFEKHGCCLNDSNPLTEESYISMLISRRYHPISQQTHPNRLEIACKCFDTIVDAIDWCIPDQMGRNLIHNIVTTSEPNHEFFSYDTLMKQLRLSSVDIDFQDYKGKTALHLATQFGNKLAVKELLDAGTDVNIVDKKQNTALKYALNYYLDKQCNAEDNHFQVLVHLVSHVRTLEHLNLYVSSINREAKKDAMRKVFHQKNYHSKYLKDVDLYNFKDKPIIQSEWRVGDFLSDTGKGLLSYSFISNETREKIDAYFCHNKLNDICMLQYRKAVKRIQLVESAKNIVWAIAGKTVPIICVEMIFQYLRNYDLENFVKAGDATIDKSMIIE